MSTDSSSGDAHRTPHGPRPGRITAAAVLAALEGAVIAGLGAAMLAELLSGNRADDAAQAVAGALTVLALAALPLAAARGLWLRRRWSRGPAVIVQLLALPVGWQMTQNGGAWPAGGAAVVVTALAVLACLVNPTATEALGIGPRGTDDG